jgi:hypothetical protein
MTEPLLDASHLRLGRLDETLGLELRDVPTPMANGWPSIATAARSPSRTTSRPASSRPAAKASHQIGKGLLRVVTASDCIR